MQREKRKDNIIQKLQSTDSPVSASSLAKEFGVSRQIIVGDIAILRAEGQDISSTPRGYVLPQIGTTPVYRIACKHDSSKILEELNAIVDCGGILLDVSVEHPIYGELVGNLHIANRLDAKEFADKIIESNAPPLSLLTGGIHLHAITCRDENALERIKDKLRSIGILFE